MLKELIVPSVELSVMKQFQGNSDQLGYTLKNSAWQINDLPNVAIIGIPEGRTSSCPNVSEAPDAIRQCLYSLSSFPENFRIIDLGNIRCGKDAADTFAAVKMVAEELSALKIPLLILGGSQDITEPLISGFEKDDLDVTIIDDRIDNRINDISSNDELFINNLPFRTVINIIGGQSYFINQQGHDEVTDGFNGNVITLGEVRSDIREMEPLLRGTDLVSFDFGAIKLSEAPGQFRLSPNGLTGEEACQLAWYSGIATSPVWFGLFGYAPSFDSSYIGAMMAAQICWYYLNGISKRTDNTPVDEATDFLHFHVPIDELEETISFLKHPVTNRWWMEVPSEDCNNFPFRIPCSKKDYRKACKNEIPNRWWKYFNDHTL